MPSSTATAEVWLDTAGFLALWDASDAHHHAAVRLQRDLVGQGKRFRTSDYVLNEALTLLRLRHSHAAACDLLSTLERSAAVRIEWMDAERLQSAAAFFRKHRDKEWSFTDCTSFCLMKELKIREAFTTDHHFRQAGFIPLLR